MKKRIMVALLSMGCLLAFGYALAQEVLLDIPDNLSITRIKPLLEKKGGSGEGRMLVEVEIKNTGNKAGQFIVFASGRIEGGWEGGRIILPKEGTLEPRKTVNGVIRTDFMGKELPSVIMIEASEKTF